MSGYKEDPSALAGQSAEKVFRPIIEKKTIHPTQMAENAKLWNRNSAQTWGKLPRKKLVFNSKEGHLRIDQSGSMSPNALPFAPGIRSYSEDNTCGGIKNRYPRVFNR